ncbi:MAG: tetratricopeptide repeat protein [Candidatus Hydrogenedentes bacterium]|nr:tetratricopeptide repeat protein [Candidatus Hydrogenedentota bacterium]
MSQRHFTVQRFYRFALGTYLFVLVLALYAGTNDPTIHVKHLLTAWAAGLLAGSYLLVASFLRIPLRRPAVFLEVSLCLLAFFLISSLFSEFRAISLLETSRFFSLFALYWLATQVYGSTAQVLRLFAVFCCAVFFAAIYAVMQAAGLDPFPWTDTTSDTYTNLPATYGNPNFAAHALILAFIMLACLIRSNFRWGFWIAPLLFFHFYSTDQRAGWIALAGAALLVGLGVLLLRRPRRPVARVAALLGVFALLGVAGLGAAMFLVHARTGHIFPLDLSLLLRYQSYVSATRMLFDAPILGHGPAVYGLAYAPYWTPFEQAWFAQEVRMNAHVHNDLLEIAIDGGLAAAGLYLTLLVLGMAYGLLLAAQSSTPEQRRVGFTFAALFCAFAIDGLFGFNLRVPVTAALFFLMMGTLDGIWTAGRPVQVPARALRPGQLFRLAFLALLVVCTWFETRTFASEYHMYAGMKAQGKEQYEIARVEFEKAGKLAPWNWHYARRLGLVALDQGKLDEALANFDRALVLNPHYVLTHLPMARANLMLAQQAVSAKGAGADAAIEKLNLARAHAEAVLKIAPDFPSAIDVLGRIESIAAIINRDHSASPDPAVQAKHWENARQYLRRAIDQGPENSGELYRMLMQVELGLGNVEAAESALIGAIEVAPEDPSHWPAFLKFARQHKRFDRLRDVLFQQIDRLLAVETPTDEARGQLATAYGWLAVVLDTGFADVQGAMDAYNGAVQHGPLRPELWSNFAAFARKNDRLADFSGHLRASCARVREQGGKPLPQVEAVDAVLKDPGAQLDQASRVLLAGVRSHPRDGGLSIGAAYLWAAQMLQEAYDTLAAQGAAPCESALNLGVTAAGLNELSLANILFEKAMACLSDERRASAAVHWADTLVRLNQRDKALAILEEVEAQFPGHFDTRWAKARTLVHLKRPDEARVIYESLLGEADLPQEGKNQLEAELKALQPAK